MVFALARTFHQPAAGAGPQRGFPSPGSGAQTSGDFTPAPRDGQWSPERPTQGRRTFWGASQPVGGQQGFPAANSTEQRRPAGSMPNIVQPDGLNHAVYTPYYSRGAAAYVQNYGKVLTNPIGAGVVAKYRPQASYGSSGQYVNGEIFWTSQAIPTTVNLQGLTDPAALAAVLGPIRVQAVVRTTG